MSYKEKPQLHLYEYKNNSFSQTAIIDDYQEISFEHNLYEAGNFTITINYNIPNALKFERGMFIQFGNNPYMFGEILRINDSIGEDGKGSQIRSITGKDARFLFKRRIIKNLNNEENWIMTDKGEICIRNLVKDQCGTNAETKRQLPITNTIPAIADAVGKEYSVSESYTNLYDTLVTIATQSETGWRIKFDGSMTLECYEGNDISNQVQFSTEFDSLSSGQFSDSSESYANSIYIGGKGIGAERDIYEGENSIEGASPSGLDRYEAWDNQSEMTSESEYEAEALSMLAQYGQTVTVSGKGLVQCPYIFQEQYDIGDVITIAFSGKSAKAQILAVTEHWTWGRYSLEFSFGKPQNDLARQLQLILKQIQKASSKTTVTASVKWYTMTSDTVQDKSDVIYDTIGFTGAMTSNKTFTFYLDDEKTGAKTYNIYAKNLSGNYNLTLTTGVSGASNFTIKGGSNIVARILVDENGNIVSQSMTATDLIESGNNQPATSGGVQQAISQITETNIIYDNTITDCNNAFQVGKSVTYCLGSSVSNIPSSSYGWYVLSQCNPATWSSNNCVSQIATVATNNNVNEVYIRHAYLSSGTMVWRGWEKLVKSSEINYPLILRFSNNTGSDKIIHLGRFNLSLDNKTRCNILAEARRADGAYRIMASVYEGVIKKALTNSNTSYFDIRLYKTSNTVFDLYLIVGSYVDDVYVNLTEYAEFSVDGSEVSGYSGTYVLPAYDHPLLIELTGNSTANTIYWKLTGLIPVWPGNNVYFLQARAGELLIISCGHGDGLSIVSPKVKRLLNVYSKIGGMRYNGRDLYIQINAYSHEVILTMMCGNYIYPVTASEVTQTEYNSATAITIEE